MVTYLPRSAWTAATVSGDQLRTGKLRGVAVHWPGTTQNRIGDPGRIAIADRLRSYRNYHVSTKGWRDIGYNLAIDQAGRIWACRTNSYHGNLIGAHCASPANPDANEEYVGVLLLLGDQEQPSDAMIEAFWDWYQTKFLPAYPGRTDVRGHGQVPGAQTACPGPHVRINQLTTPQDVVTTPQEEDDDMTTSDLIALHKEAAERSTPRGRQFCDALWAITKHPINAQIVEVRARQEANTALLAELVDRDTSTTLTGEQVKQIVENAIRDNVVKVDVTIESDDAE